MNKEKCYKCGKEIDNVDYDDEALDLIINEPDTGFDEWEPCFCYCSSCFEEYLSRKFGYSK